MAKKITADGEVVDEVTHQTIAMAPPFWKTPNNHDTAVEAAATALYCKDPTRTKQEFAKDADINNILRKFLETGELQTTGAPIYQDIEDDGDLQDKIVTTWEVDKAWNALSSEVKNSLKDPATFVKYIEHCIEAGDIEPLRKLGLAVAEAQEQAITPGGGAPTPPSPDGAPSAPKS